MHSFAQISPARRAIRAFTLIELLTVIAIIGILAAIIIPTVGKVRQTAKNAQCASVLREWGRAVMLYANDNKGFYTYVKWYDAGQSPYTAYFGQKGETATRRMRVCPLDPEPDAGKLGFIMARGSINGNIDSVIATNKPIPLSRATNPSQLLLLIDGVENSNAYSDYNITSVMGRINEYVMPMFDESLASNEASRIRAVRHGGKAVNAVFADGSIKRVTGTPAGQGDQNSILERRDTWFQIY